MEFDEPHSKQTTVYSKSGCINCKKVKQLLEKYMIQFNIVDCDEYILENKEDFLLFIKNLVGHEYKTFPMVFNNGVFIGGYNETVKYFSEQQNQTLNFDESF